MTRRIVIACVIFSAASLALNGALAISGHPARYSDLAIAVNSLGVLGGLLYLRSVRGRP